jgi:hypothetical protein
MGGNIVSPHLEEDLQGELRVVARSFERFVAPPLDSIQLGSASHLELRRRHLRRLLRGDRCHSLFVLYDVSDVPFVRGLRCVSVNVP